MVRVAKFYKVSKERFMADFKDCFPGCMEDKAIEKIYEELKEPRRATTGSAGYDIFTPIAIRLKPGQTMKFPTGFRVQIENGWALFAFPRSGLGFKYRLQLDNTVGIIDSDYFYSDNEGHIFVKITNDSKEDKVVDVSAGIAVAQGVFLPYGITLDDNAIAVRNGGFGSTGM